MSKATASAVPSSELCDRIAVLNEEGMELRARLVAFAGEAGELGRAFDSEIEPLDLAGDKLNHVATHCGLGVLHALIECMQSALAGAVAPWQDEEMAA